MNIDILFCITYNAHFLNADPKVIQVKHYLSPTYSMIPKLKNVGRRKNVASAPKHCFSFKLVNFDIRMTDILLSVEKGTSPV